MSDKKKASYAKKPQAELWFKDTLYRELKGGRISKFSYNS